MNGHCSTDASTRNCCNRLPYSETRIFAESPDEEICVTGLSGLFPSCRNVGEFEYNLYNKIDMVTESDRWSEWPEVPKRRGNIPDVNRFDAQFFGVHHRQADTSDPQGRLLQERAYEAITDAGINPKALRGSRTGVFIGACFAESERTVFYDLIPERGFGLTGCSRAMMANRISYSLGLQGPSLLLDTACSSSMYALDVAFSAIRSGQCDAAIVGGANLILHPTLTVQFAKMGVLAEDGICRPFDKDACGYVRAEAISTLFLQKAKDAKRIYAKVLYSKTNCDGYKDQGITAPSQEVQQCLLEGFYSDLRLNPTTVDYVEAHCTGTVVGDPKECTALDNVFCQERDVPLLVGSVKSNMGHAESASGMCSIAKVVLALERGEVAPNLYFTANRPEIKGLMENRMKVCTERTTLPDNALVGISSSGFGGANAHALLQGHTKVKQNDGAPVDDIPRLVNWSGRTEESVSAVIEHLQNNPLDAEFIGLLQNIQNVEEPGFIYRGYGVYGKAQDSKSPAIFLGSSSQRYEGVRPPLVWIFSGMGSQWPEMGSSLMCIPQFADSIQQSHDILKPFDFDLLRILTDPDKSISDDILNAFTGIVAVQIGIVDVLNGLGLQPDYIIGHSMGEIGCGYADGALTRREAILSAYYRGVASQSVELIRGAMAAVGLGYRQIEDMLPADIVVACHNSAASSTISGPEDSIKAIVAELASKNIYVAELNYSHIAYHSRYVTAIADKLLEMTKDLYSGARRSSKWLSTSVPISAWSEPKNQIISPEYYVNNLLKQVLFEESSALLPANMVAIEIAPHGMLQSILKRSMPDAVHIPLTQRGHSNNVAFFLSALGRLYMNGFTMPIDKLYPPVAFPVSRGTPKISPLVRWNHDEEYYVSTIDTSNENSGGHRFKVNLSAKEYAYIEGHLIDDRCLFPATGYLELVWVTFARMKGKKQHTMDVEFEDIQFLRATALQPDADVELTVIIQHGNGSFEVSEGSTSIVTGIVREMENMVPTEMPPLQNTDHLMLDRHDFYKELRLCGYHYKDAFASVVQARSDGSYGRIRWTDNWVTFMDCMLQIMILTMDTRSLVLPTRIQKVRIFGKEHLNIANELLEHQQDVEFVYNDELNVVQAGGIEIIGLVASAVSRRKAPGELLLESYAFVENFPTSTMDIEDVLRIYIQLVIENNPKLQHMKVVEMQSDSRTIPLVGYFAELMEQVPKCTAHMTLLTDQDVEVANVFVQNTELHEQTSCNLIMSTDSLSNEELLGVCEQSLVDDGFLIVREQLQTKPFAQSNFNVISTISTGSDNIWLLKRKPAAAKTYKVIDISNKSENFDWLEGAKASVKHESLLLVAQHDRRSGVIGLLNCLSKEPETMDVCCFLIDDERAPEFDVEHPMYANQLALNIAVNVFRDGAWGSYRQQMLCQDKMVKPHTDHLYANVLRNGDLSSFSWIQGPLKQSNNDGLVRVQYSSINFKDVMLATGRLSSDISQLSRLDRECVLGLEYSGTTQHGRNVMGTLGSGSMATLIKPYAPLTWDVPAEWSMEQAATVPVVYLTVYYAFFTFKAITAGKTILIHAGSGGVGLAAIRVALAYGLEVFTTVSTKEKKNYILNLFPRLKACNIGNSRDCSFERMIKLRTHGKGVDYVLNSLSDEKLHASIRCLSRSGTFLEIGKFDLSNDTKIGMAVFLKEIAIRSVVMDNLLLQQNWEVHYLHGLIERDLKTGIIQPLDSIVFRPDEIEKAYRYMSTGQHMGKVLIQIRHESSDELMVPVDVQPRAYFEPECVYIISGGLGGLGLELADWMVLRGARKVMLNSRRGVTSKYQSFRIRLWETYGCKVFISTANITTLDGCETLIADAQTHGAIDGIFHLACCLLDSVFENQTTQSFKDVCAPKVDAMLHLDAITRQRAIKLTYFVVFSSIVAGRGNAGQTNYGLANSAMERMVERRVADRLSGKAIQWGPVREVGAIADLSVDSTMTFAGTLPQRVSSVLSVLDTLLTTPDPIVASMVVAQKSKESTSTKNMSLVETVLNIMCIRNLNSISMTTTLNELGLDSLMTIEIKQALEREFEIYMSSQELRTITFLTLQQLSENASSGQKNRPDLDVTDVLIDMRALLTTAGNDQVKPVYRLPSKSLPDAHEPEHLLIVPGAEEDHCPVWRSIARQLNVPTYICKCQFLDGHTIPEIANTLAHNYLQTVPRSNHFILVGYSYGTLLAIEIARLLESQGMTGRIMCIDGSPAFVKKITLAICASSTFCESRFEHALIGTIAKAYLPRSVAEEIAEKVNDLPLNDKLSVLCTALRANNADFDDENLCSIAYRLHRRTLSVMAYETVDKIRADITLVRAQDSVVADIDETLELSSHTTGEISVKYVAGNHRTILDGPEVIGIINTMMQSGSE